MANVSFTLNGKPVTVDVEGDRRLVWILRTEVCLTGTKFGCGKGTCGSCTVVVDRRAVRSCMVPVKDVSGKSLVTIEGLADNGTLHPLQKAFMEHDALQCGFCTPGMIMKAYGLLLENPKRSREEIIRSMDYNLCRCGAHLRIIRAIEAAAQTMIRGK